MVWLFVCVVSLTVARHWLTDQIHQDSVQLCYRTRRALQLSYSSNYINYDQIINTNIACAHSFMIVTSLLHRPFEKRRPPTNCLRVRKINIFSYK